MDVYILENESLLVGKLRGTLDLRLATKLVELVEFKEQELERGFNRVCDLTHLQGVRLTEKMCKPWRSGAWLTTRTTSA